MKFIKEHKIWFILGSIPVVLFLIYKLLLSFKGTTLLLLTFLTFFSLKMDGVSIEDVSGANPHQAGWLMCYAEKVYWSKHEKQNIWAYEIYKNDPDYKKLYEDNINNVLDKSSTNGRNETLKLENSVVYIYQQRPISEDFAKNSPHGKTIKNDIELRENNGYQIITPEKYCSYTKRLDP